MAMGTSTGVVGRSLALVAVLLLLSLQGCLSYSRGNGPQKFDGIYVAPVRNYSLATQAQALLTKKIRTAIASRGGLTLLSSPKNAVILETTITKFEQSQAAVFEGDTTMAKTMDIAMTVRCTLRNDATGEVYFSDHDFSASLECVVGKDFQGAKYQIMPQLTDKLADQICAVVYNLW